MTQLELRLCPSRYYDYLEIRELALLAVPESLKTFYLRQLLEIAVPFKFSPSRLPA